MPISRISIIESLLRQTAGLHVLHVRTRADLQEPKLVGLDWLHNAPNELLLEHPPLSFHEAEAIATEANRLSGFDPYIRVWAELRYQRLLAESAQ